MLYYLAVGGARGGITTLATETALPPLVGGRRGQDLARAFTLCM